MNVLILHPNINAHLQYSKDSKYNTLFSAIEFNHASDALRHEHVKYIDSITKQLPCSLDWIASSISNRNMFSSDTFLNISYLAYCEKILETKNVDKIICENISLKKSIQQNFKTKIQNTEIEILNLQKKAFYKRSKWLKTIYLMLQFFSFNLKMKIVASITRTKSTLPSKPISLADIFVTEGCFKTGQFVNRYYSDFIETSKKITWAYFPTFYELNDLKSIFTYMSNMKKNKIPFIIKENYLGIKDYFWAFCHAFRIKHIKQHFTPFNNLNIDEILNFELYKEVAPIPMQALLNYCVIKNMHKKKIEVQFVLDWFEGQSNDRTQNFAFHKYYPNIKIIGYVGFFFSDTFSSFLPTPLEQELGITPDQIAFIGDGFKEIVSKERKALKTLSLPAFRYSLKENFTNVQSAKHKKRIIIALPLMAIQAVEILDLVCKLNIKELCEKLNFEFIIKPHPVERRPYIKNFLIEKKLDHFFEIINVPLDKLMPGSSLMISIASSAFADAFMMNIPTIIIASQTQLSDCRIPFNVDKNIWATCYTVEELSREMLRLINITDEEHIEVSKSCDRFIEKFLNPPCEQKFIDLENYFVEQIS